jgi:pilus assembly protein TadC
MPEATQLNLSRYVPAIINLLANKLATGASQCYRKHFGIGVVAWCLLVMLKVEDNITANRMSQVDSQDALRNIVSLSAAGLALHDRVLKVALERERRLLGDLSEEEVDVLLNLLGRLQAQVAHVNEYDPVEP